MATPDEVNTLLNAAKCYTCIPPGMEPAVMIVLLQQIAETSMTPGELLEAAKCYQCIPPGMMQEVQTYLLLQILNALEAG